MRRATVIFGILFIAASASGAERLRWPLDTPPRLSSSFGEYREGHYHAGIDLRTFGRIGLPCRAVGGCAVVRLRISPQGYGKAVYVKLADGTEAVYAHLNAFNRSLDSLAYRWRLDHGTNWCDIDLRSAGLRLAAGRIIAYTGTSGSPHPHLHFEMRDAAGRPFNPLESIYKVADSYAPVISALEVVPLARGSIVNGSPLPLTKRFHYLRENRYALEDTLQLDGVFGFGVSAWDRQDQGSYRLAPYSVGLFIDGALAYRVTNRRVDYARIGDIVLEYDERGGTAPSRYLLLFRKPGNAMEDREGVGAIGAAARGAGVPEILALADGFHRGEIVVRDANGNAASASFGFSLHRYPVVEIVQSAGGGGIEVHAYDPDGGTVTTRLETSQDGGTTWSPDTLDGGEGRARIAVRASSGAVYRCTAVDDEGARIERYAAYPGASRADSVSCRCRFEAASDGIWARITTDRILATAPSVSLGGGATDSCLLYQVGPREYLAFVDTSALMSGTNRLRIAGTDYRGCPLGRSCTVRALVLEGSVPRSVRVADSASVSLAGPTAGGRIPVVVGDAVVERRRSADLVPVGRPFRLDFPLDRVLSPILCDIDGARGAGVYRWVGTSGWRCVGIPERDGGPVSIGRPGVYAVFRDVRAPELRGVATSRRAAGSGFFKHTLYYVTVRENGSGVDPNTARAVLDGRQVVCEWDDYRGRLEIPIPASRPPGTARLDVEIRDRAGNRAAGRFTVVIE
jgi:hypothetical protein